ncbi:transporter substrate-binding domain-containing protein [Rhodoferax sp. AJA081-3]|uniref:transporter substrate-binding domain-containing protein n=1 Tax=Rhodoferax sp. AJA081-3 TaxID=2752316 RepID=UPI001ADF2421|nr:transporter substrate-binding domain-containing protein [Rhodoferax sp. AJA081-3]QTN27624.1 transporter substrate-binding domain-containing protein [Rhodoferax sp. AJA081-3]
MPDCCTALKRWCLVLAWLCCTGLAHSLEARPSPVLQAIQQAGTVRIGVKTDVQPFGHVNSAGEVVGFEIDLAEDIAKRLGVRLQKIPVSTENRFQKLELGEVDLLLATVADSLERRAIATAIEPGYFEAGVTVMLRPGQSAKDWNALRGKDICALQGAYFNRPTAERYILNLQTYKTVRDALLAVEGGYCEGFLYNGPAIRNILKREDFRAYSAPFHEALVTPWAMFIKKAEAGTQLEAFLGDTAADWYRNGLITRTAQAWKVSSTSWPADELELWNRKEAGGAYTCLRNAKGLWPPECRHIEFVRSVDVSGLQSLGIAIKERSGVDLSYVYDAYDRKLFLKGLLYTMLVTALSIFASLAFGVVASTITESKVPYLSRAVSGVMGFGRLVPPLLMMYGVYFGIGGILLREFAIHLPALLVTVLCIGYYSGAIVMNAFDEAAQHLRRENPAYRLRLSTLRVSMEHARWPVRQALINVSKMSMIASAIAIPELLSQINLIIAEKGNLVVMMLTLITVYYMVTSFWIRSLTWLEHRLYPSRVQP